MAQNESVYRRYAIASDADLQEGDAAPDGHNYGISRRSRR